MNVDENEIKKVSESRAKSKSDGLCSEIYEDVVGHGFRDEESQKKLLELMSKSIPDFGSSPDGSFSKYMRAICWGF